LFEIEIAHTLQYVLNLDNHLVIFHGSLQRGGIASALILVDTGHWKAAVAMGADHGVARLSVPLAGGPTDIARIKSCADDSIGAFEHKEPDGMRICLIFKMARFSILKQRERDS
jgi:hypothetical protein